MSLNRGQIKAQMAALVDDRQAKVASYKVRGFSLRQTQTLLEKDGVVNPKTGKAWSLAILARDLQELQGRWRAEALADISELRAKELQRIDELEREAWAAWHRGIGERKQTFTKKKGPGARGAGAVEASVRTEDLNGDPRYLQVVRDCQADRRKILGLDAPAKIAPTNPAGDQPFVGGVLVVPGMVTVEGWEEAARTSQAKLQGANGG
jgi:hypothetical protein